MRHIISISPGEEPVLRAFGGAVAMYGGSRARGDATLARAHGGGGGLVLVSYALLRRDAAALGARPWAWVVLDEV